jgi:hypothetical protein
MEKGLDVHQFNSLINYHLNLEGREQLERERWVTGGQQGGSCWDDGTEDKHYSLSAEDPSEFYELTNLINLICPNITLSCFNQINRLKHTKEYTEWEYYGNYTEYAEEYIALIRIYEVLKEHGYV